MYKFSRDQVLDPKFLTKLIDRFKVEHVKRFMKNKDQYMVKTEILSRPMTDGKPNNKLAHGFARYITNMATSYFMGKPIRYQTEDAAYMDALQDVFDKNYIDSLNFNVSKEASKKGIGYLLMFINEAGQLRIKKMDAESIIPIYSTLLDEFLTAAVHIWSSYDIDGNLLYEYADVYDSSYICHYRRKAGEAYYEKAGGMFHRGGKYREPHMMGDIPVIVIWNNEEQMGDFEAHISLMDAYDRARSDTANDMDYFTDAYLAISGASDVLASGLTGDDEEGDAAVKDFRKNKILLLDEKGQAQWLVKNVNDTATENHVTRLYKDIFFLAQVPALSDESFSGNLSGIAIKYKLIGVEELAIMKENCFRSAQTKMIRIITDYLNTRMNKNWDPDSVEQKYERNFIDNVSDLIEEVKNVEGIVSHHTQLDMLPSTIVPDTEEELQQIRKETIAAEELPLADLDL